MVVSVDFGLGNGLWEDFYNVFWGCFVSVWYALTLMVSSVVFPIALRAVFM